MSSLSPDIKTAIVPTKLQIQQRKFSPGAASSLIKEGVHPLLARVLAARGLASSEKLNGSLKHLIHHSQLKGTAQAAIYLAQAIEQGKQLLVVADYDCDGATACAVAVRGLRNLGANVNYIVPDRMIHGYGLTGSVVDLARQRFPSTDVLITVDNGIASYEGIDRANELGMEVMVTDHHLPGKNKPLPAAKVIVNPSQPGCPFPSKALAGVGVIWYVLWALQDELRARGRIIAADKKVSTLLPLVCVGTVADVVPLDENNRIIVQAGLMKIRKGESFPGIDALATVGVMNRTEIDRLVTSDIAFGIGPRINAAGRLKTMDVGIECLITDDIERAECLAEELNNINQARKDIEHATVVDAVKQAEELIVEGNNSIVVNGVDWHQGVIGIVAGRIKEKRWRPTFVLTTDSATGIIKGSGRSIPGLNLKDILDQVDKAQPGLMLKFGGHAMAAGVTITPGGFERFREEFEQQCNKLADKELFSQKIEHDGELTGTQLNASIVEHLNNPPWGQMFLGPTFCNEFTVLEASITGARKDQLNMRVAFEGVELEATQFRYEGKPPSKRIKAVYSLEQKKNKWGKRNAFLLIHQLEKIPSDE